MILLFIVVILLAMFVLTPRAWEPGPESWKQWAAARILRETGGFPVSSLGPLYVSYLQIFSFFEYPLSMQLEYAITHLFVYLAIFFLLQKFMRRRYALLLTIAWIPHLAVIEPGGVIAGIGFLCLYLAPGKSVFRNQGYFPPALLAAALCHSAYILFLGGHVIGTVVKKWKTGQPTTSLSDMFRKRSKLSSLILTSVTIGLLFLFILPITSPSSRFDHNHMLTDQTYSPITIDNPLELAFFQYGNDRWVKRNVPESEWVYQDWYFTQEKAYGSVSSIAEAVLTKPALVMQNILSSLALGLQLPAFFFAGKYLGPASLLLWILVFLDCCGLLSRLRMHQHYPLLFSIALGTLAVVGALALSSFNIRYVATLLPIGFLIVCHIGQGAYYCKDIFFKKDSRRKRSFMLFASFLILMGIIANGKVISSVFLPYSYEEMRFSLQLQIWIFQCFMILLGILLLVFKTSVLTWLDQKDKLESETLIVEKKSMTWRRVMVLLSTVLLFVTISYPLTITGQAAAVLDNEDILSGADRLGMVNAYPALSSGIDKNTKILTLENHWVQAFTTADLDNVYQVWGLPPFEDQSGKTEEKLSSLDLILVSSAWEEEKASLSTQSYLRYLLHVKPFLEAHSDEWDIQTIDGYGKMYVRKKT